MVFFAKSDSGSEMAQRAHGVRDGVVCAPAVAEVVPSGAQAVRERVFESSSLRGVGAFCEREVIRW